MFDPVSNKVNFPQLEEEVLAFWKDAAIFQKSLDQREGSDSYVFYDGPPFATGLPHYGHLLAGTIKDIVPRYQTMRGHYVERRFGWDCHGLPIEALAMDALGLAGTTAILEAGVDVFNEKCRSMVDRYTAEWEQTVTRMGRWVDFERDYKTMDTPFMESIWWVFKQLWDKGRVYKSYRIMPYSWALTTPLSNFEANSNYKDVQDPAVTVRFGVTSGQLDGASFLAWTTTPWTLPSNLALCVGPEIDYVAVNSAKDGNTYILAEARLGAYYKSEEDYEVRHRYKGADLVGWTYEPLLPYFADHPNSFRVLSDDFVTTTDGTGIVHMAPAYGEDDYRICGAENIELVDALDMEGKFTDAVPDFAGRNCKEADADIIKLLKEIGKLVHKGVYKHSYPFCERSDTPLIYRAIDAWYVKVDDINDKLVANNDTVHWQPGFVGGNRFGTWLKDARDWNISRNRFWGSCLPVWINEDDPEDMICVGSIDELEQLSGVRVDDLHKHVVDEVLIERDGKTYRRTPEVLDCWFESGSMPYAQKHYPFENADAFGDTFPADFIAEGLDQTRGWFYTLMVLSTTLFEKAPFKNVVVNGMILAANGEKMSKSKKNYPPPEEVINQFGADALRLYLINSPVVRAEPMRFVKDEEDRKQQKGASVGIRTVEQTVRELMIPWWNSYSFFVMYANTDNWQPSANPEPSTNLMDRWVLSAVNRLNAEVVTAMDDYDLQGAVKPFVTFIGQLTNWYIRLSRRRFWKSEDDSDKAQAYATLYTVLKQLSLIGAPFVPFLTETIYRNLKTDSEPESVHLCDFPLPSSDARDEALEAQMALVQSVVGMGRSLRTEYKLKTRQPLKGIHVVTRDKDVLAHVGKLSQLVQDELNIKEVWFGDSESELVTLSAKANFKVLGKQLGPKMKAAAAAVAQLDNEQLAVIMDGGSVTIDLDGESFEITEEHVLFDRTPREGLAVASEGSVVVALETELTPELHIEYLAREINRALQQARKDAGLEITDRIKVRVTAEGDWQKAVETHRAFIMEETLALELGADVALGADVFAGEIEGVSFELERA